MLKDEKGGRGWWTEGKATAVCMRSGVKGHKD